MQRGQILKPAGRSWTVRFYDTNGKRHTKGGFKTKGEASAWLSDRLTQQRQGRLYRPKLTVGEFLDVFLGQYDAHEKTVERVTYMLAKVPPSISDTKLQDLTAESIATWRKSLNEGLRWEAVRVLRQALNTAVGWNYLNDNPAKHVKNPAPKPKEINPFDSWLEIHAVAAELSPHYRAIPIVAAGLGLRPGEWIALKRRDIDLAAGVAIISRAWDSKTGKLKLIKTGEPGRRVPLRAKVRDALLHLPPGSRDDFVFASSRGNPIDLKNWRSRQWKPALEAAGVDYRRIYDMRHTYAAMSLRSGVNTFTLARRMGTSLEMIDKRYGHLANDSEEYEIGLLDAYDQAV